MSHRRGGLMPDMSRRTFVTTGASLFATCASLAIPRGGECRDARSSYHGRATPERGNEALSTTLPRLPCALYPNDRYCLQLGRRHATPNHIRLLMDCAQMCTTTVAYMARESSLHDRLCGLCSEMCRLCAESCEQTAGNEQMVKQCAELLPTLFRIL